MTAKPNRVKFTQALCERLPIPADDYDFWWDLALPGFGIRVSPKGRKTWLVAYRISGTGQKVEQKLDTMAVIPLLSEARKLAQAAMHTAHQGVHPVKERKAKQAAEEKAAIEAAYTLDRLLEDFIAKKHHDSRPATVYEVRRLIRRALPFIGDKPVKQIEKADIRRMIDKLATTRKNTWRGDTGPALTEASGVLRHLRSMFRWAVRQDIVDRDPTLGVDPPTGKRSRDRVLSDDEIVALWRICDDDLGFPFGPLIQLLLLTGQREMEVAELPWGELGLDNRTWSLPGGARTKNGNPHEVHLSVLAREVIDKIPRFADNKDLVFSVNGERAVTSFSDAKQRIDVRMTELLGEVPGWVFHDLRRTMTTGMARLKVPPHVADKVLNHTSGTIRGVAAVYNRFSYVDERRAALDAWGRYIEQLVYPQRAMQNVVALRGR